jgi:hypothetical protein
MEGLNPRRLDRLSATGSDSAMNVYARSRWRSQW